MILVKALVRWSWLTCGSASDAMGIPFSQGKSASNVGKNVLIDLESSRNRGQVPCWQKRGSHTMRTDSLKDHYFNGIRAQPEAGYSKISKKKEKAKGSSEKEGERREKPCEKRGLNRKRWRGRNRNSKEPRGNRASRIKTRKRRRRSCTPLHYHCPSTVCGAAPARPA